MGGEVRVIVRQKNGKVTKMNRWTNSLPSVFITNGFKHNPEKVLQEYIDNQEADEKATSLSPKGYGLIVIDEQSKTILTHQHYSSFDETHVFYLHTRFVDDFDPNLTDSEVPFLNLDSPKRIQEAKNEYFEFFMNNGFTVSERLTEVVMNSKTTSQEEKMEYAKLCEILQKEQKTVSDWKFFLEFAFNPKISIKAMGCNVGYKVKDFRNVEDSSSKATIKDLSRMKKTLEKMGFKISKASEKDWVNFVKEEEWDKTTIQKVSKKFIKE